MLEYQNDENKFVRPEPVKKDWRQFEVNDVIDAKVQLVAPAVSTRTGLTVRGTRCRTTKASGT